MSGRSEQKRKLCVNVGKLLICCGNVLPSPREPFQSTESKYNVQYCTETHLNIPKFDFIQFSELNVLSHEFKHLWFKAEQ